MSEFTPQQYDITDETMNSLSSKLEAFSGGLPSEEAHMLKALLVMAGQQMNQPQTAEVAGYAFSLPGTSPTVNVGSLSALQSGFAGAFGSLTGGTFKPTSPGSLGSYTTCVE